MLEQQHHCSRKTAYMCLRLLVYVARWIRKSLLGGPMRQQQNGKRIPDRHAGAQPVMHAQRSILQKHLEYCLALAGCSPGHHAIPHHADHQEDKKHSCVHLLLADLSTPQNSSSGKQISHSHLRAGPRLSWLTTLLLSPASATSRHCCRSMGPHSSKVNLSLSALKASPLQHAAVT